MHKAPLYKWILLLLIPLMGIAFIVYKKLSHRRCSVHEHPAHEIMPEHHVTESVEPIIHSEEVEEQKAVIEPVVIPEKKNEQPAPTKKKKAESKKNKKTKPEVKSETQKDDELAVKEKEQSSVGLKEIALTDELTKKSFGYKHWTGMYYPSKFILKLNNTVVLTFDGKEATHVKKKISIDPEKTVLARFDFEFLGGKRHGWKEVVYQVDKNTDTLKIDFDWKDKGVDEQGKKVEGMYQILLSPAKPISVNSANNHEEKKKK